MREITVEELKKRIDSGEQLNIIDVREPSEYAETNMGAKLIPLGNIQSMVIEELEEFKNKELIIHCRSGKRSMTACILLEHAGFSDTVNLVGGILAWNELVKK